MSHPILVAGAAGGAQGSMIISRIFGKASARVKSATGLSMRSAWLPSENPQTLEQFFRENSAFFADTSQEA